MDWLGKGGLIASQLGEDNECLP
ncbi:hypothetical protein COMA2_200007 [Candidatus Nitrospira nitrificans]|uniref:Uncharacterized protein n=1 Tax=Candidatus Nitrospira nitrificans TaxID=1742973 RepID=A0A0S4LEF2_9BACT|nr:hypothetical protein COMA2_200007 [Candidatus Nitrospira nitrificans]